MPAIAGTENGFATRFWPHYGSTWNEVVLTMLSSPFRVAKDFFTHGFTRFNEAFFYLGIFNPINFILIHAPGVLLYTALDGDKNMLQWYNAAPLLPGMLISVVAGWYKIIEITKKITFISPQKVANILAGITCIFALVTLVQSKKLMGNGNIYFPSETGMAENNFNKYWGILGQHCQLPDSIAADEFSLIFVPIHFKKYRLENYEKAQLILVDNSIQKEKSPSKIEILDLKNRLRNESQYVRIDISEKFLTYVRADYVDKCKNLK